MKRILSITLLSVFLLAVLPLSSLAQQILIPVGEVVGLHVRDDSVTVAAFDEAFGSAAREAGLQIGDRLMTLDGSRIRCTEDIRTALNREPGQITLTVSRNGRLHTLQMVPEKSPEGFRLGVYLRQGISGVGTVTWYDPDTGRFGSLGHGVNSAQGMLLRMQEGAVYPARITGVVPGRSGHPGLIRGNADSAMASGTLYRNTAQGIFGKSQSGWKGEPLPVAAFQEVHTGNAAIRSTVSEAGPRNYSVEILKIYPEDRQDCRNFLLRVTDPELLHTTGGIVQGMSGSPIIQDGRLIGAVTHVMVSDPTTGYGIFIGNMLDAAA